MSSPGRPTSCRPTGSRWRHPRTAGARRASRAASSRGRTADRRSGRVQPGRGDAGGDGEQQHVGLRKQGLGIDLGAAACGQRAGVHRAVQRPAFVEQLAQAGAELVAMPQAFGPQRTCHLVLHHLQLQRHQIGQHGRPKGVEKRGRSRPQRGHGVIPGGLHIGIGLTPLRRTAQADARRLRVPVCRLRRMRDCQQPRIARQHAAQQRGVAQLRPKAPTVSSASDRLLMPAPGHPAVRGLEADDAASGGGRDLIAAEAGPLRES